MRELKLVRDVRACRPRQSSRASCSTLRSVSLVSEERQAMPGDAMRVHEARDKVVSDVRVPNVCADASPSRRQPSTLRVRRRRRPVKYLVPSSVHFTQLDRSRRVRPVVQ